MDAEQVVKSLAEGHPLPAISSEPKKKSKSARREECDESSDADSDDQSEIPSNYVPKSKKGKAIQNNHSGSIIGLQIKHDYADISNGKLVVMKKVMSLAEIVARKWTVMFIREKQANSWPFIANLVDKGFQYSMASGMLQKCALQTPEQVAYIVFGPRVIDCDRR